MKSITFSFHILVNYKTCYSLAGPSSIKEVTSLYLFSFQFGSEAVFPSLPARFWMLWLVYGLTSKGVECCWNRTLSIKTVPLSLKRSHWKLQLSWGCFHLLEVLNAFYLIYRSSHSIKEPMSALHRLSQRRRRTYSDTDSCNDVPLEDPDSKLEGVWLSLWPVQQNRCGAL